MSSSAFNFILFSALMHALWNLLVKRSTDKTAFIWWMFVCAVVLMMPVAFVLDVPFVRPDGFTVILAAISALCFVLYHLLGGYAYRDGDFSVIYPLAQTAMIYVPLWGVLFLGERMSLTGFTGICAVVLGSFCVQLKQLRLSELLRPFRNLSSRYVQAALAAGLIYSIGAIADKIGIGRYHAFNFTYILVVFMLLMMTANLLRDSGWQRVRAEARRHPRLILVSGPVIMTSFLTFRYGLSISQVSYAVPVRQVSLLIGVLIGVFFLHESCGKIRFMAVSIVLFGAFLLRMG